MRTMQVKIESVLWRLGPLELGGGTVVVLRIEFLATAREGPPRRTDLANMVDSKAFAAVIVITKEN
jgi:hypothetical protein